MARPKFYLQPIQFTVAASGGTVTKNPATNRNYKKVIGIALSIGDTDALEDTVFSKFNINGKEVLPENTELRMIYTTTDVSPDERFFGKGIEAEAEGNTVDFSFTDAGNAAAYPYSGTVYLLLSEPVGSSFGNPGAGENC